jgi:hypothetical protein
MANDKTNSALGQGRIDFHLTVNRTLSGRQGDAIL